MKSLYGWSNFLFQSGCKRVGRFKRGTSRISRNMKFVDGRSIVFIRAAVQKKYGGRKGIME